MDFHIDKRKIMDNLWWVLISEDVDKDPKACWGSAAECEQEIKEVTGKDIKLS